MEEILGTPACVLPPPPPPLPTRLPQTNTLMPPHDPPTRAYLPAMLLLQPFELCPLLLQRLLRAPLFLRSRLPLFLQVLLPRVKQGQARASKADGQAQLIHRWQRMYGMHGL
jgi:hypothetical protein